MDRRPLRVALAEDDLDDFLMTEEALEDLARSVHLDHYEDGRALLEALEAAVESKGPLPDLILMDLNMPRMDGREAIRAIKENPTLRPIPIVVLTTSGDPSDVVGTYSGGANAFITKPVTHDAFVDAVQQVISVWDDVGTTPGRATRG